MGTVAILLPDFRGGGVERIRLVLAKEFKRLGHDVEFVVMRSHGELHEEAQSLFPVVDLQCDRIRLLPFALARYLRKKQPEALLAAMWPMTVAAPLGRILSRHPCKVVVSEHNTLSVQYAHWGKGHNMMLRVSIAAGYRLADAVVSVSTGVAGDIAQLSGIARDRFTVIHNPIPTPAPASREAIKAADRLWQIPPGKRIIAVGRFKKQKNHDLLLRAFAKLADAEARLLLLGTGRLENELRQTAARLGAVERIIFAGFQSDTTPYYETADLFILSSDYEGFGNVIVEAMACGLSVVSTDCPHGPAEILADGEFGALVPIGDEKALCKAMRQSLETPTEDKILRRRASEFKPERAARAYLKLLGME